MLRSRHRDPNQRQFVPFHGNYPKDSECRGRMTWQGIRNALAKRTKAYLKDPTRRKEKRVRFALMYYARPQDQWGSHYDLLFERLLFKAWTRRNYAGLYSTPEDLQAFVNSLGAGVSDLGIQVQREASQSAKTRLRRNPRVSRRKGTDGSTSTE